MASPTSTTPVPIPRRTRGKGRTTVVPVRLTPAERDSLAAYAERHGSSLSTVLSTLGRQVARGGGDQVAILAGPSPALSELATSLHRIGVSLNQIARRANQGGKFAGETVELLALEVRDIVQTLRDEVIPWV